MDRWREDFQQKGKIRGSERCTSMVYSTGTEVSFLCHVALKLHNTWTKQIASSVVFGCLSPGFYTGR